MFVRLALSLGWVVLTGFLLTSIFLKNEEDYENLGLRFWLGIGTGFGVASINFFLWRLIAEPQSHTFIFGEILILIIALAIYGLKLQPHRYVHLFREKVHLPKSSYLLVIFLIIAGISAIFHLIGFLKTPQGAWDAWAIWNTHARFLIQDSELWERVFSPLLQHPDYPMLLPANVARAWIYMGKESPFAPALIGAMFTFSLLGLLVAAIGHLRQPNLGYLAGIFLMSAPAFHFLGLAQYADVPLAYYILSALVLFNLGQDLFTSKQGLVLVGLLAGFSVWTKNEGWLFILVLILARVMEIILFRKKRDSFKAEGVAFLIGIVPILVFLLFYQTAFTPANDLIAGQGVATIDRLITSARHITIVKSFLEQIVQLNTKNAIPFIALPLLLLILGINRENFTKNGFFTTLLVPILMVAGYYLIFLTTPKELDWHLATAKERLFFHIWPVSILATFLMIKMLSSAEIPLPKEKI